MSHFVLAVITKGKPTDEEIEKALAPYDENKVVVKFISKEELIKRQKDSIKEDQDSDTYKRNGERERKWINEVDRRAALTDDELYAEELNVSDEEDIMPNGSIRSTYNPKAEWDWYQIGGRWAGYLIVNKSAKDTSKGSPSWMNAMDDNYSEGDNTKRVDGAMVKDLVFTKDENGIENKNMYTPYAVLTKDGEWKAKGKMRWFGMSEETADADEKFSEYFRKEIIDKAEDDDYITIINCHI